MIAAKKMGIHGILFKNREQAIKELESILSKALNPECYKRRHRRDSNGI